MKRKRSVRMITKLLILSLILGLCLPSFTDQVLAESVDSNYSLNIGANEKNVNTENAVFAVNFEGTNNKTASGDMAFLAEDADFIGKCKYIVLYANEFEISDDSGFLTGIDIPLNETEADYGGYIISFGRRGSKTRDCRFKGITFEDKRLQWNFFDKAATDRKYIVVDSTNQRIPVYFLGAYNSGDTRISMEKVSSSDIESVNNSMSALYRLVDEISNLKGQIYSNYPEHAELLKEVSCEVRRILERQTSNQYDSTYLFPTTEDEWKTEAEANYWATGKYSEKMFLGVKEIIDGYVDYVNTHKIAEPVINSVKINDVETSVNNETHEIIISGKAEDFADRSLSELEITLPDGVTGSWGDSTKFSDTGLAYHVWPYNENLGDAGKDKYKDLGQDYTVKFDIREQTYTPEVKISPENLTGAKADQESYTDPKTKKTTYTVTASSQTEDVTDQQGQHYAFSHWELDEANRELESAIRYSDYVTRKVHNSTSRMESFVMPPNPLTMTAVYKPAYRITEENEGLNEGTTFELSSVDAHFSGWNPEDSEVELYYYDRTVPKGYLVKEVHVSTNAGTPVESTLSSKNGTNYIRFTMPSDDVKVTVTFEKDKDNERKLTLGEPTGTIIAGKGGTATYELTAEGYSEDASFTVAESYSTGVVKNPATEGLAVALDKGTSGKGTVTVTVSPEVESDKYYFCVTPSEGKKTVIGTITVLSADTKMLKAENTSITLKENESGEVRIKGSSMNLSAGASVEAFETNQDGQIKYSGKTEGLTFDKAVLNNDAFTLTAHVSKTVAKGEYYFIIKADNEQSAVAKLTVDREKAETPDQPEKETQKITVTSNASQGSIQITVAGGSEELISGTGTVKAVEGDKVTVTAMPKDGYKLSVWKITQGMKDVSLSSGTLSDSSVSFVMPAVSGSDTVTVGATFDKTSTEPVETSEPKITAFSVANVSGTIDQESGTITVVVPNGTDVTSLCPAIAMSGADSVTPANGAAVNFTNSVTYTVKNASGVQKSYVVTVKVQEASVSDTLWDKITSPEGDRSWWKKADSIKSHKKNKYPKYW